MNDYYNHYAISNSDLGEIKKSIWHYLNKKDKLTTEAMTFGKAFHSLILEPEKFNAEYGMLGNCDLRTKIGKEYKKEFEGNNKDKTIISNESYNLILKMQNELVSSQLYREYLVSENCEVEKDIYFEYRGIDCRAKLDYINHDKKVIIDLKTIKECSDITQVERIIKYNYCRQAAFYKLAMKSLGFDYKFMFVFVEKETPNFNLFVECSEETIAYGEYEYNSLITKYLEYIDNPEENTKYSDNLIII